MSQSAPFEPYVRSEDKVAEMTPKAILIGALFGVIFGASTVYLALKAGLTVSASIPIAVVSISLLKRLGGSTILENNLVQTIGSAGESIAAGVIFTLPGFLFLTMGTDGQSVGAEYFDYWTIFTLALLGGMLGVLMMIPLRRSLIVDDHGVLPYPEGTACAGVLIAGERGGNLAKVAFRGLGIGTFYAIFQQLLHAIAESPAWVTAAKSKILPAATVSAAITPEYLGVGYILGVRNAGLLVAGSVLAWLGLIPLLATLVPHDDIAAQLTKLGYDFNRFGWDPATHQYTEANSAIYYAYVRQIGAGAVAAGGFITLLKTLPTIISAFTAAMSNRGSKSGAATRRVDRDLPLSVVLAGSVSLVAIMAFLPFVPGDSIVSKILLGVLMIVFGFFFVTVSSRICGIIGTSSNPISGMTIAAVMATCLIFVGLGWTQDVYQPMALCVGGIVCIAAANAGATSQDLKTGYLVGATPRAQQLGLMVGCLAAAVAIGLTVQVLDHPSAEMVAQGIHHAIGTEQYPAPQGTLMATLIKGLLAQNLDWQFVLVGMTISVAMELCSVRSLAFAVGVYLPISTTLPIFCGGAVRWAADRFSKKRQSNGTEADHAQDEDLGPGNLFSTGLVAAGALTGVLVAALRAGGESLASSGSEGLRDFLEAANLEEPLREALGTGGYDVLGIAAFVMLAISVFRTGVKK